MTAASSTKAKERELKTINPATEELINTYEIMTKEQISEKAKKAQDAFSDWKKDIQKRVDHIHYMSSKSQEETHMWRKKIKMIGMGQQPIQAKNKAHESALPKELDRIGLELINTTATFDGKV